MPSPPDSCKPAYSNPVSRHNAHGILLRFPENGGNENPRTMSAMFRGCPSARGHEMILETERLILRNQMR
jgi:hypothetical protein